MPLNIHVVLTCTLHFIMHIYTRRSLLQQTWCRTVGSVRVGDERCAYEFFIYHCYFFGSLTDGCGIRNFRFSVMRFALTLSTRDEWWNDCFFFAVWVSGPSFIRMVLLLSCLRSLSFDIFDENFGFAMHLSLSYLNVIYHGATSPNSKSNNNKKRVFYSVFMCFYYAEAHLSACGFLLKDVNCV